MLSAQTPDVWNMVQNDMRFFDLRFDKHLSSSETGTFSLFLDVLEFKGSIQNFIYPHRDDVRPPDNMKVNHRQEAANMKKSPTLVSAGTAWSRTSGCEDVSHEWRRFSAPDLRNGLISHSAVGDVSLLNNWDLCIMWWGGQAVLEVKVWGGGFKSPVKTLMKQIQRWMRRFLHNQNWCFQGNLLQHLTNVRHPLFNRAVQFLSTTVARWKQPETSWATAELGLWLDGRMCGLEVNMAASLPVCFCSDSDCKWWHQKIIAPAFWILGPRFGPAGGRCVVRRWSLRTWTVSLFYECF